jgi:hypothetical protein
VVPEQKVKQTTYTPEFVEFIPDKLEDGVIYVSLKYGVAIHLCACGCKERTVTPLGSSGWNFSYNGAVTLQPSISNYQTCRAHYFIENNTVRWA